MPGVCCHLGRCGAVLQLAAKRPTRKWEPRVIGHDRDRGVYLERWNVRHGVDGGHTQRRGHVFHSHRERWYKAAYYDPSSGTYWMYPTQNNIAPNNSLVLASTTPNEANYFFGNGVFTDFTNFLTPVGKFSASPGPFGTYDMGGDVFQWSEAVVDGTSRGWRGGSWYYYSHSLASSNRLSANPTADSDAIGFRIASVPEPDSIALLLACGVSLLASGGRRRRLSKRKANRVEFDQLQKPLPKPLRTPTCNNVVPEKQ